MPRRPPSNAARLIDKPYIGAWPFPSSKGTTDYETILYADGTASCNCPGWIYCKKMGEHYVGSVYVGDRICGHISNDKGNPCIGPYIPRLLNGSIRPEDVYNGISPGGSQRVHPQPPAIVTRTIPQVSRSSRLIIDD